MPQSIFSRISSLTLTLTALTLGLGACSSGDAVPGKGIDDTVQSFDDGFTAVGDGLEAVFTGEAPALRAAKAATFDGLAFNCESGGTGTVSGTTTGDASTGTFDLEMSFQGCNGMTGTVGFGGDYVDGGTNLQLDIDFTAGSSLANDTLSSSLGCSVFFRDLLLDVTSAPDVPEATGTAFGAFRGNCVEPGGNVIVDCSWDNLDFNDNDLLASNCICSGEGC